MSDQGTIWIGSREIAQKLDISVATFRTSLKRLIERDGFPLPCPHKLKPMTWRREAVERWIDSQGYSLDEMQQAPAGQPAGEGVHVLRIARAG